MCYFFYYMGKIVNKRTYMFSTGVKNVIILILTLFFLVIMFIPMYINLKISNENGKSIFEINIFMLKGIIKFSIDISLIKFFIKREEIVMKVVEKIEKSERGDKIVTLKQIIELKEIIRLVKRSYKKRIVVKTINNYMRKKIQIKKFIWMTRVGLDDAALTGIINGVLWGIKSSLVAFLFSEKRIKQFQIEVIPVFNQNILETYFDCIIKFKLVYIIIAGYYGLKAKIKGGEISVKSSN